MRARISLLVALGTAVAGLGVAAQRAPIGVAASDYPFLLQGSPVTHHGTLLEGEAVTSAFMPVRVRLSSGGSYVLGIGSQARFTADRMLLEGVSLEIVDPGPRPPTILVAGLEVVAQPGSRATLYTDRADILSVSVVSGDVAVRDAAGQPLRTVAAGEAYTFSDTGSGIDLRVQEKRASLEIARIQMRQLEHLGVVEQERPGITGIRERMRNTLIRASGGLLGNVAEAGGEIDPNIPTGLPAVDPEALLTATRETEAMMHRTRLDLAGCGSPSCASPGAPIARNDFSGAVGTLPPPYPGCALCREALSAVEPAP